MRYSIYFLLLLFLASCSEDSPSKEGENLDILCDAENVEGDWFVTDGVKFNGAIARSSDKAHSGKYSAKLDEKMPFGFTYDIVDVKKGDIIEASVWKHKSGETGGLVIAAEDPNNDQYQFHQFYTNESKEWGEITGFFVAQHDYKRVKVYALNADKKVAYFDDLKIKGYFNNIVPDDSHDALEININTGAYDTLKGYRKTALEQGVITSDLKEYINASLNIDGEKVPIELRLKGDWTDHLETNKWSFRIKVGSGHAFRGMRTFSIQNPLTRSFMHEWLAHRMFEREDILTTRYIFVPVIINGEKRGVYALEEHFDKQLLEYRKRREGPIMKFDESGIWQLHYLEKNERKTYHLPVLESAAILPFKKNRTRKSETLSKQFRVAQGLMERYRDHDPAVDEYFDVESLAKFMALSDVINGKHGSIWHNQRNYFNPVTNKLEPIAYDCFMAQNLLTTGAKMEGLERRDKKQFTLLEATLSNPEVEQMYFEFVKKFSDRKYVESAFKELEKEIAAAEKLLNYEYPNIKLDRKFFLNNAKQIRTQLKEYSVYRKEIGGEKEIAKPYQKLPENVIFTDIALKANIEKINTNGSTVISLRNFHSSQIEVYGYSTKADKQTIVPISPKRLSAFKDKAKVTTLNLPVKPRRLHYRAANCPGQSFKAKLSKWGVPKQSTLYDDIMKFAEEGENDKVIIEGKNIYTRDLVIPKGKRLIIKAGTKINLTGNAAIVSYSPVEIRGTKENPVVINSEDGNNNGVVVLSSEKSKMSYVTFDNLNTMHRQDWTLTGAVTFYGGDVKIDHCTFTNNNCEDGLNLIRCTFDMQHSTVANTYSDGFDADFCTGTLKHSTFENTGNDCIDFSGSEIDISYCKIINAGDKGVSGGEDSNLKVQYCTVDGAHIAIASKDLSRVEVSNLTILKAKYGFAAYCKKPEYGPAKLTVDSMKKMNASQLHLLEKGSSMHYMGKDYFGKKVFDIDAMYAMYAK